MTAAMIPDTILKSGLKGPLPHGRGFAVCALEPTECPTCGTARAFFVLRQHIGWDKSEWSYECAICDGETHHDD